MRRPSFCLDVRFGLSKLTSQLRQGEIACGFLLARNFTDALLLGLNSLGFLGKGLAGIGLFLKAPTVKRPCDGTSGLVRGDRRKAVFAFKGLFPKGICHVFALGQWVFIAVFGSTGKPETSERNPIFTNRTAGHKCKTAVWSTDLGFSPHFRKRLFPACGKLWNP